MNLYLKYQRPAMLWALLILILCSISFGSVGKSPLFFPGFDKLVHCGLFFVLATLIGYGYIRNYGSGQFTFAKGILIFVIAVAYGGLIEILQLLIFTWRSAEWDDLFADSVGAGMAIFSILVTLFASSKNENN